jgi:hypothetical protein
MSILKHRWLAAISAGFIQSLTVFVSYALVSLMVPNTFTEITRFGTGRPEAMAEGIPGTLSGHVLGPIIWTLVSIIVFFLITILYRVAIKAFVSPDGAHPKAGLIIMCCVFGFLSLNSLLAFFISQNLLFAFTWLGMITGTIVAILLMRKIATPVSTGKEKIQDSSRRLRDTEVPEWALEKARRASEKKS